MKINKGEVNQRRFPVKMRKERRLDSLWSEKNYIMKLFFVKSRIYEVNNKSESESICDSRL